jgi:hypothetical protein
MHRRFRSLVAGLAVAGSTFLAAAPAAAHTEILVLTGNGTTSLTAPLTAAGYSVVVRKLEPGALAAGINSHTDAVYIWNDGSLGNSFSAANPALAFNAADQAALTSFAALHTGMIMDGLAWRSNGNADERSFSENQARALVNAGGGIVLGADDASGALIVQHVNQVAGWLGYNLFAGVYNTSPANQIVGGTFFTTPNAVNVTNVVGTTTYSEVPNGLQPNGSFLSTAVFGFNSTVNTCCGAVAPLGSATFNGVLYNNVNHVVTTNIAGAGINPPVAAIPEPETYALFVAGLAALGFQARRRTVSRRA